MKTNCYYAAGSVFVFVRNLKTRTTLFFQFVLFDITVVYTPVIFSFSCFRVPFLNSPKKFLLEHVSCTFQPLRCEGYDAIHGVQLLFKPREGMLRTPEDKRKANQRQLFFFFFSKFHICRVGPGRALARVVNPVGERAWPPRFFVGGRRGGGQNRTEGQHTYVALLTGRDLTVYSSRYVEEFQSNGADLRFHREYGAPGYLIKQGVP